MPKNEKCHFKRLSLFVFDLEIASNLLTKMVPIPNQNNLNFFTQKFAENPKIISYKLQNTFLSPKGSFQGLGCFSRKWF